MKNPGATLPGAGGRLYSIKIPLMQPLNGYAKIPDMKAARQRRIELPEPVRDRAAALCASRGVSLADWLNDLIACALDAEPEPPQFRRRRARPTYLRAVP